MFIDLKKNAYIYLHHSARSANALAFFSDEFYNKYKTHTHATKQLLLCENTHTQTFSVHMSTHLSTDMFWITAAAGSASVTLSGLLKQPLKMALPSETQTYT